MKGARIESTRADVNVGRDLTIESLKSKEDSVKVDVELSLSHTNDKSSSVTSKLSKVTLKKFEKRTQEKLDSGIKDIGLMYNNKVKPKDTMGGSVSVKNLKEYIFQHYLLRQNPVILLIKRHAIWAVN